MIYWKHLRRWRLCQRLCYFYHIRKAHNKLKIMSDVVLLLQNTNSLQQIGDYGRDCSTSMQYWHPSTSWRLCEMLFYFYHIRTAFNKVEIRSKVVLLLWYTDRLQLVEEYVRCCSTFIIYGQPSTWRRLCQRLFYFLEILTAFNKL